MICLKMIVKKIVAPIVQPVTVDTGEQATYNQVRIASLAERFK